MAYAESTIGGTYGGSFRCWVNSIRTYDGNQSENYENWRVEGGVNRVSTSGGRIYNGYNNSTYTIQLGINGMATSGNWSYDSTGTGGVAAWGSGTTTAYRNSAGVGFGFTSRTDVNMNNSPYLTAGWVQSSDGVQTKYRHASLTGLSMDAGGITAYDEGPMWLEFTNPGGAAVDAFLEAAPTYSRVYTSGSGIGSRFNFPWSTAITQDLQQRTPSSNTNTIRIGIHDSQGGDNWDYRDRTYTIKNDVGQANPTFTDFDYLDTNSTTVAVTGDSSVLVQGLSTLQVNVPSTKKATPNKFAALGSYNFTIGGYSGTATWPSTGNVTQNVGAVSDVTGTQSLGVRAVDARGNGTTVSKNVTVLPYSAPGFYGAMEVKYANGYDYTSGLTVSLFNGVTLGAVSPMTLSGTDKNFVNTTTGVKFDVSKNDNTHYTGTKVNVTVTNAADHSGYVNTTASTLATAILNKMATLGQDNTTKWFITFEITDKFQTKSFTTSIDIGRPIFRIGQDGWLYHNEVEMSNAFNNRQRWIEDVRLGFTGTGTWGYGTLTGFLWGFGWCLGNFTTPAIGDYQYHNVFLTKGTYDVMTSFVAAADSAITRMTLIGGPWGTGVPQFDKDNYAASTTENTFNLTNMVVLDSGIYTFRYDVVGHNASSSSYVQRVVGIRFTKTA